MWVKTKILLKGELRSPVSFKHDEVSLFIIFENGLKKLNSGAGMSQHIITPKEIPLAFQTAWNKHDMQAFAALFDKEATFVNRFGHYVKGVDEIIAMHQPIHETIYRDSTLENELIDIIPMSEDICISHFWSRLTAGVAHPQGPHQIDTLILTVLIKKNHSWYIQALENVTLTNPRTGETILRNI
ncbi:SgcJ/EcaC family oxidoreductase [Acinetobacter baumannii]|uniref:SgcJ/EcaC family oxidoreductase n=1 Tax=Acinetobacter baumannii TaxID=470 RepID=UPI000DE6BB26|nr:SgcJ/EcaC family oxidoreductase [Acinetobacter baumannii]MDK2146751.1 SgcJ/EcaC family oxidoreductase [Acinetobacter baumannii]MDK2165263.1 SgcJ/EcaC family oxidoreductase [Acinetobacter baumannii]MDK2176406.1 SgcJ/EcaC family oxidoreductase [Acinetobacter baumannii]MDK2205297.1 SgcJ/EcaC family oxidoreductase [Acinetobacter baumannii]MDK2212476.1 SgcJ/EcaC family oxidoreductase [Acinetobacter baumannii]